MAKSVTILILLVYLTGEIVLAYRLCRNVIPRHYSLKLHPNLDSDGFQGEVSINVFSKLEEDKLILHSKDLTIISATVNQQPVVIREKSEQRISLWLEGEAHFQPGNHLIRIVYNGTFQENFGLTKSQKSNSQDGFLIVSESQPSYARKIFPCFDEPYFKARFNVRLITPNATYRALSNMPEIARYSTKLGIIYDFATSVEMSTYLLCVAITDYPYHEDMLTIRNRTIPIRVYTSNASKKNNDAAIQAAKFYMNYYTEYTGIEYPLPKLDFIEYKKTVSTATETWGLVQFNEGFLSFNKSSSSYGLCVLSISHELSHFWFGNLVTNDWWNDLWLQEGYASFVSQKSTSARNLTADVTLKDVIMVENTSLLKKLVIPLNNVQDTEKRFDLLVYRKGAYLLKSLESLIGEELFRETSKQYLEKHLYKTVTTNDLISAFEMRVPSMNVRSFLESYMYQVGCPLINVDDTIDGQYTLTQFYQSQNVSKWTVPISYRLANETIGVVWFDRDLESVVLEEINLSDWIIFNSVKKPGLYIVNYTETMWLNLVKNIETIPENELTKLGENLYLLYISKYVKCDLVFKTIINSKKSLDWIAAVIEELVKQIMCFPLEYRILQVLINNRFDSYKYQQPDYTYLCSDATDQYSTIAPGKEYCLKWVAQNLVKGDNARNETNE